MRGFWVAVWLVLLPGATAGQGFQEVAAAAGVNWPHDAVEQYFAVGQAWGDYDGDGWLDLYLTTHVGANVLLHNDQDGTFSLAAESGDVELASTASAGAVFADYDNDGDQDLYVANRGPNSLFRNDGASGFTEVTTAAGVGDPGKGSTASWGDYDADGWLDLYVANWLDDDCWAVKEYDCAANRDRLYRNLGDGTFADVSDALGDFERRGLGFVASFVDYDNDGDVDLYLVNDAFRNPIGNQLWRNDGPGAGCGDPDWCWTEVSASAGANTVLCGMGLAICDYDRDGDLDFYFSNAFVCGNDPETPPIHHLLQNQSSQGSPTFLDTSVAAGVAKEGTGWGTVCLDYDNDGWQDLYLTQSGPAGAAANALYHNNGDGTFTDVAVGTPAADPTPTWGVAAADYDRDGRVDLLTTNRDAGSDGHRLLHNQHVVPGHHWLAVELTGGNGINRDAAGARVWLETGNPSQPTLHLLEVKIGSSLGAGDSRTLHFGLGLDEVVHRLEIRWPDGSRSVEGHRSDLDQVLTRDSSRVFADGFESGNPALWTFVP